MNIKNFTQFQLQVSLNAMKIWIKACLSLAALHTDKLFRYDFRADGNKDWILMKRRMKNEL